MNHNAPQHSVTTGEPVIDSFYQVNLVSNIQCGNGLNNKPSNTSVKSNMENTKDRFGISPNPTSTEFDVSYVITQTFEKAELVITDITGRIIMPNLQLADKNVRAQVVLPDNIRSGMLFCALVIDGKVETVKKVIVNK